VIGAQRPVILTGIEEFVRREDLSDRCVYLNLPSIADAARRREEEFWPAFHLDQPKILGALLDAVAGGMRELPSISLAKLPRMADFAAFGEAVGRVLGWPNGRVLADYNDNRREAALPQLEDSLVANAVIRFAEHVQKWSGTASQLLSSLTRLVHKRNAASSRWPKTPGWLTNDLRRIAPQLRVYGILVTFERNHRGRQIAIVDTHRLEK
jgi:hypothetical protein